MHRTSALFSTRDGRRDAVDCRALAAMHTRRHRFFGRRHVGMLLSPTSGAHCAHSATVGAACPARATVPVACHCCSCSCYYRHHHHHVLPARVLLMLSLFLPPAATSYDPTRCIRHRCVSALLQPGVACRRCMSVLRASATVSAAFQRCMSELSVSAVYQCCRHRCVSALRVGNELEGVDDGQQVDLVHEVHGSHPLEPL